MIRLFLAFCLSIASPLAAQHTSHAHPAASATEFGQGGFAALAEIVALMRADPATDWTQADLGALRQHLQDMDALVTLVQAHEIPRSDGLVITIARNTPGADAAWWMVPAHAPVLAAETGWHSGVALEEDSLTWTTTDPDAADQIQGLGFFGLMAIGNHHPAHHMALATGRDPHGH